MAYKNKYSLVQKLNEADETLTGSNSMYGISLMSYPEINNGTRMTMLTSHIKQLLTPVTPDIPMMFAGIENTVGKYSTSSYKMAKGNYKVIAKVVKFGDIVKHPQIYTLFAYDKEKDEYVMFERTPCENLTEMFGFNYNNDFIDSLSEGDMIHENDILYKSTSYDEDMNYRYGQNANVMYTLIGPTAEDAAIVSESFAKNFLSIETETISIQLNDNDFLLNIRGDDKNYKPLPDVGETADDYLAAVRRQFNDQLLYDFMKGNLSKISNGDKLFYLNGESEILDYTIYSNAEERRDTSFDKQINKYLDSQNKYYKEILDVCEQIINSGSKYSQLIDYTYKRSKEMLDTTKKWKRGDSAFSNKEIVCTIRKILPLSVGQKITGRYGNKSVISTIWPDEKMPFTEDGRHVDVMLNLLAIMNRTTMGPLYEPAITGIADKIRIRMKGLKTYTEREDLLFDFVYRINEDYCQQMKDYYYTLSEEKKNEFIDSAINEGIYLHVQSTWDKKRLLDRMIDIFQAYDWIDYDTMYINHCGWKRKCMNKGFIGRMYIVKLKQSGRKGFSARSMEAINSEGVPARSHKNKIHQEINSSSPIRFGEYENYTFNIGVLPDDIATFYTLYRSSIDGRRYLMESMFCDDEERVHKLPASFTSRVAEILGVYFKTIGIKLDFVEPESNLTPLEDRFLETHKLENTKTVAICSEYDKFILDRYFEAMAEVQAEYPIINDKELQERINGKLLDSKFIVGSMDPVVETNDLLKSMGIRDADCLDVYKEIDEETIK